MIKRDATRAGIEPAPDPAADASLAALVEVREAQEYNGWSNYPTWCVHLWLSNDQKTWEGCLVIGRQCIATAQPEPRWACGDRLEQAVRGTIDLAAQAHGASVFTDLIGWTLGQVDWPGVADSVLEAIEDGA